PTAKGIAGRRRGKERQRNRIAQRSVENGTSATQHVHLEAETIRIVTAVDFHQLGGQPCVLHVVRSGGKSHHRLFASAAHIEVHRHPPRECGRQLRENAQVS